MNTGINISSTVTKKSVKAISKLILNILNTSAGDAVKIAALESIKDLAPKVQNVNISNNRIDMAGN